MLPGSMRRVVTAAPPSAIVSSLASSVPRPVGALALACRAHACQRRHSSSKPSRPDNGTDDLSARPSKDIARKPTNSSGKAGTEKRSKKAKDAALAEKLLPSVPTTEYVTREALSLSTFFSLHRPISVTRSFPKTVTDDEFAAIFDQPKPHEPSDVINTLSQTVNDLEAPIAKLSAEQHDIDGEPTARLDIRRGDGTETPVYLQLSKMAGQFMPYIPPPAPEPVKAAEPAASQDAEDEEAPLGRWKAMFTLEETIDEEGKYKLVAHSPKLIDENTVPRTYLERVAQRQLQMEEGGRRRLGTDMMAISVRRQRKLKMKKKKFKKFMRKTRNLRRKLDKL